MLFFRFVSILNVLIEKKLIVTEMTLFFFQIKDHKFTGHNLSEKKVEANAAHRIVQTIASGMLECDTYVSFHLSSNSS